MSEQGTAVRNRELSAWGTRIDWVSLHSGSGRLHGLSVEEG